MHTLVLPVHRERTQYVVHCMHSSIRRVYHTYVCSYCSTVVQYYHAIRSTRCACMHTVGVHVAMYWYMEAYSSTRPSTLPYREYTVLVQVLRYVGSVLANIAVHALHVSHWDTRSGILVVAQHERLFQESHRGLLHPMSTILLMVRRDVLACRDEEHL